MAAKYQESKNYPLAIQCFIIEFRSQPIRDFMNIKWVGEEALPDGTLHYQYQHGMGMASWGETIDIYIAALGERATRVEIRSECYLPTQVIDWGKNRENVVNIFMYLDNCVNTFLANNGSNAPMPQVEFPTPPAQAQPVPQPQQPMPQQQVQYQPPVQPVLQPTPPQQKLCPTCRFTPPQGANFCPNCGTKLF